MRFSRPLFDPESTPAPAPETGQAAPQATPASQTPAPAPTTVPAPTPTTEQLQAQIQQLNQKLAAEQGSRQLAGFATQAGLKSAEDIAKAQEAMALVSKFQEANVDPATVLSVFAGKAPEAQQPTAPEPITQESIDATVRNAILGVQSEQEHKTAWAESERVLDSKITELSGGNEALQGFIESRLVQLVKSQMSAYPEGHPLAGKAAPVTTAQIEAAAQQVQNEYQALVGANNATDPTKNPAAALLNGNMPAMPGGGMQANDGGDGVTGGNTPFYKLPKAQRDQIASQQLANAMKPQSGAPGALSANGI